MADRSSRPEIRNPVLALPEVREALETLSPEARRGLAIFLRAIAADARHRAQKSWRQNKGPMALYWKVVGVYAGHLYRAVRP